jgi:hypothetical protein
MLANCLLSNAFPGDWSAFIGRGLVLEGIFGTGLDESGTLRQDENSSWRGSWRGAHSFAHHE